MAFKLQYAVFSGICAASAGAFGKLSGLDAFQDFLILRLIFFVSMILCNAAVWTLFVKALHQSSSSFVATIVSSTSNFLFTAILGYFLLGEITSTLWWTGMAFIICGLMFIVSDDDVACKK
ncbi:unnamed protein product [Ceutorhynchus assimilis]|uniref:Transmembrane protein 42 n=1 Tax=Ceutorhynchus assimilis TaxID=467358 RepID=A0A9N9MMV4_9CUCU|nr:unnamed protein product [Ceutorhynchus assimilis]